MTDLGGRVALVTGGSVGTALARRLLAEGANVALIFRDPAREAKIHSDFAETQGVFQPIRADLSNYQEARSVVETAVARFGGIDFLLNSLGGWVGGKKLHEHDPSDLAKMFNIDVIPTFNIMSASLRKMMEQKFGKIVNFISLQALGSGAGNAVYAASKAAIMALTNAAAAEYSQYGISVFGIAPSIIDTEANRKSMAGADTSKWVSIDEIVDAAMFLCRSGDAMSGTILKFPGKI